MESIINKVGCVFLPGDVVSSLSVAQELTDGNIHFGPGLRNEGKNIVVFKAGTLSYKETPCCLWINSNQKRYVASKRDTVIGIVTNRGADNYKVDIGCSQPATLSNLAFEGATKRHKPNLKINDLVFGRLTVANKDMEPEMSCVDESAKSSNMGQLSGGYMFNVSSNLCRQLLAMPDCKVLTLLGKHFPFEITVGMNCRVWINSKGIIDTIAISNAIVSSEYMEDNQIEMMVKQLVDSIAGFDEDDEA